MLKSLRNRILTIHQNSNYIKLRNLSAATKANCENYNYRCLKLE